MASESAFRLQGRCLMHLRLVGLLAMTGVGCGVGVEGQDLSWESGGAELRQVGTTVTPVSQAAARPKSVKLINGAAVASQGTDNTLPMDPVPVREGQTAEPEGQGPLYFISPTPMFPVPTR